MNKSVFYLLGVFVLLVFTGIHLTDTHSQALKAFNDPLIIIGLVIAFVGFIIVWFKKG